MSDHQRERADVAPHHPPARGRAAPLGGAALLLVTACPLPQNDPRGLELAWMFVEGNDADSAAGAALRTCDGARAKSVEVTVADRDDPTRSRAFAWACETSWATPELFFVAPPPVFLDLQEGTYVVDAVARDELDVFSRELATIAVDETTTTSLLIAFALPQTTLAIDLEATDACDDVALRLRYADAEADVVGAPVRVPADSYRDTLAADEGVAFDGAPVPCDALPSRLTVRGVDRGRYMLERVVDGSDVCLVPLEVRGDALDLALDLGATCPG